MNKKIKISSSLLFALSIGATAPFIVQDVAHANEDISTNTTTSTSATTKVTSNTVPTKRTTVYLPLLDEKSNPVEDKLNFKINGGGEVISTESNEGEIKAKIKHDTSYNIKIEENNKYTMESFDFTLKNGAPYRNDNNELIFNLDLKKKAESTKQNRTTLYLSVLEGNEESEANVSFEFKNEKETLVSKNDDGQTGVKLLNDTSYNVKIKDNDKYNFDTFNFTLKNGIPYRDDNNEQIVSLDIYRKGEKPTPPKIEAPKEETPTPKEPEDCGCDDSNQEKVKIKQLKIVDIKNPNGETIKDPLTFVFFNVSKQKPAGEYTSENGKLPRVEMLVDDEYEVYLKDNDKYGMRHRHFYAFSPHYPIDMDDPHERYTDILEVIKKDKDYIEPTQPAVKAVMQVRYNEKIVKEPVTFEFVSNGETLKATSVDGVVTVNLRESVDYMVGVVDNDKYSIETFPIVIKNKQIGKFPYDHRTCWLVEYLNLVDKNHANVDNPHYTIATKDEKVRISGMDFKDLKLEVHEVDPKTIPALKGKDVLVYDINFINIYRKEVVKLKGDFTVTVPKERGRKVKAIYHINEFGKLEKREAIPGEFNSVITFKTDRFSRYALEYEDKVISENGEVSTEEALTEYPIDKVPTVSQNGVEANVEPTLPEFPVDKVPAVSQNGLEANTEPTLPEYTIDKVPSTSKIDIKTTLPNRVTPQKDRKPNVTYIKDEQVNISEQESTNKVIDKDTESKANKKNKLPNTGSSATSTFILGVLFLIGTMLVRKNKY